MTQPDDAGSRRITPDPGHDIARGTTNPGRFDSNGTVDRDTVTRRVDSPPVSTAPPVTERLAPAPAKSVHNPAPAPAVPVAPATELRPARPAKTSAAAVFGLVFGLAALFCALTAILSPAAILFGIIGLILAAVGLKMAKRTGVTGRGVAIGGLVTALLGLILGGVVLGGLTAVVNDKTQLDRIQRYIDDARANLPSGQDVRNNVKNVTGN